MIQAFSNWLLRVMGWKIELPPKPWPEKYLIIVVPHTSNWDFPLGLLVRAVLDEDIRYVGKDSLFKSPFGFLFRWLGGIPVDRSRRNKFVDAVIDMFNREQEMKICIAPEGTRKRVEKLKTGFYYIALGAGVPLLLCKFDYGNKLIGVSEPFYPTGDVEADFAVIHGFFKGVQGKVPEYSFY